MMVFYNTILKTRIFSNVNQLKRNYCNNNDNNINVLFFGSDSFSLPSLKLLTDAFKNNTNIKDLGVVTSIKKPANQVNVYAEKEQLKLYRWPFVQESHQYDIGIVVSFGHLIPEKLIFSFRLGMINVHASLLPRWRGAAPIIYSIMNGDTKTGVTIMKIQPKQFDIGEILTQREIPIGPHTMMPELHDHLATEGSKLLLKCLNNLEKYYKEAKQQSENNITYAPKVQNQLAEIKWDSMNATNIYNLYRALYSFKPVVTKWHKNLVKFLELSVRTEKLNYYRIHFCEKCPGFVTYSRDEKCLVVKCFEETWINVYQLGVEGKKSMSAIEFLNGYVKKKIIDERIFE